MAENKISRLEFLRLVAKGALALSGGLLVFSGVERLLLPPSGKEEKGGNFFPNTLDFQPASAQTAGSWQLGPSTSGVPIHATVLRTGQILYVAGSGYDLNTEFGPYVARVYNPTTGTESSVSLNEDLFCAGNVQLANGNVLLAGGTQLYDIDPSNCNGYWHGAKFAYEFDVASSSLTKVSSMTQGRWYPTCVLMANGRVFVTGGMDDYGTENRLVEIYNPDSKSWSTSYDSSRTYTYCVGSEFVSSCPGAGSPCYGGTNNAPSPWLSLYPRMHFMPSGLLVTAGQVPEIRTWNPSNGQWRDVGTITNYRSYGTSILLPLQNSSSERGKVLIVGGSTTDGGLATTAAQVVDFNQGTSATPVIRTVASIRNRRKFPLPVILPNGKVVIFGGSSQGNENPVYIPELFDPLNETWTSLAAASVARVYHGVALLLPNGSVWTASSSITRTSSEKRTEIYRPDYFLSSSRPTITGTPLVGDYGNSITLSTPDPPSITMASLVKLPCTTHHYDTDSRLVWLQVTSRSSNSVTVASPLNANLAPPGYYMIHLLNGSNIPSTASIIKIPGVGSGTGQDTTPPAQVTGLSITVVSSSQLNLNWNTNTEPDLARYYVYRGTAAGFTVTPGTTVPAGQPTTNSFSDTTLAPSTTYYYKVAAVDTTGNIGALSSEMSATTATPPDTTPPVQVAGLAVTTASSTQLDLAWTQNPESDLNHYNVYRGTTAGFAVTLGTTTPIATPNVNSYQNTGLSPSTTYYYKVSAVDNAGNIGPLSAEQSGTTSPPPPDTTPPAQVTGLSITVVSSSQLNLNWNTNTEPDLARYYVYRGTAAGFTVTPGTTVPAGQPTTNSFSDTTLAPSTTYYYKVAAVDTTGNIGALSSEMSATTATPPDTTPPVQVAGLAVTTASSTQLDLAWTQNPESDLNHYNVYRGTTAGFAVTLGTTTPIATPNVNSYQNTGLSPSTTYYYKVSAVDNAGNIGPLSAEQSGTTSPPPPDTTPPGQVTGFTVTTASATQLNLIWTQNAEADLNHYNVYRGSTPGFSVIAGTTPPTASPVSNSFSDTGLSPSTIYYYRVAAVDNAGNIGALSAERSGTTSAPPDTTPPAQVTGLAITVVSSNQLNLNWNINTEPDSARYYVYRGTTVGFTVTPGTTVPAGQPTTNSFSDTTLAPSTTYYYKVAAVDTAGNIGPLSAEQSGFTPTNPVFYNVAPPGNSSQNLKSGGATRYGEEPATSASALVGKSIRTLKVRMRKKGNPSGAIVARIRRKTDDAIIVNFTQTFEAARLGSAFADYTYTLSNPYTITVGDRILIEYSGQNGIDIETWNTDRFDGTNTRSVSFSNTYAFASTSDMVGSMSS